MDSQTTGNHSNIKKSSSKDIPSAEQLFNKRIWTITDVAEATGYKVGTLYNLVNSRNIPHKKRRGRLFFDPIEIQNWCLEGERK